MTDMPAPVKIGTLSDRIANRIVRHFPGPRAEIGPAAPIVSFTFDDVPDSAWTMGAKIRENAGVRGTYYISGGLVGTVETDRKLISSEGCSDLAARGHELGCHTFSHAKLANLSQAELMADLDRNAEFLTRCDGRTQARNFAVPYTMSWPSAQSLLRRRFLTSRGGLRGINRGRVDLYNLASVELRHSDFDLKVLERLIDDMITNPGWLIFFTHDISDHPTAYGLTPSQFAALVEMVIARGCSTLPVEGALVGLGTEMVSA